MRLRRKKQLDQRLDACGKYIAAREENFYDLPAEQRNFTLNLRQLFGNDNPVVLEIGCGKGGFAIKCAAQFEKYNFLAVEKLSNVIVAGAEQAAAKHIANLRFLNCSAENLRCYLAEHSVCAIALNFSCPFPKKTYANRRLTNAKFLKLYAELLTEGGKVWQKTDDRDFFLYSLEQYRSCGYTVEMQTEDLHSLDCPNVTTEYEEKFSALGKRIFACVASPFKTGK